MTTGSTHWTATDSSNPSNLCHLQYAEPVSLETAERDGREICGAAVTAEPSSADERRDISTPWWLCPAEEVSRG